MIRAETFADAGRQQGLVGFASFHAVYFVGDGGRNNFQGGAHELPQTLFLYLDRVGCGKESEHITCWVELQNRAP
jgi:hypothetical protein